MESFLGRIRQFLGRLTFRQKAGLGAVAIGTVALLVGTAYWSSQPEYTLLFGDLQPEDANRIVETLRQEGTSYDLRDGGTAVYVPRASVHELRLQFSSEGSIDEGQTGYELFDQGTLGMTDFMQKLNSKRALEGELARTIRSVDQVQRARVHLVRPKRDPFSEKEMESSASVVLNLGGSSLSQAQVQGISELVAGAVKDLGPAHVTVLDTDGNMLSDPNAANEGVRLTSTQLEMQRSVEEQLADRGQSMLEQVLGTGNAIVRVAAEMDFGRTVTRSNTINPESATVISEERMRQGTRDTTNSNSTVRNFEVSRTKKRSVENAGEVSRLTVSVVVNHKQTGAAEGEPTFEPYPPEELNEIESLVKNAVGFDSERGDSFTIQQTKFDTQMNRSAQMIREEDGGGNMRLYFRYGLILLALGAAVWIVRSVAERLIRVPEAGLARLQESRLKKKQGLASESASRLDEQNAPDALSDGLEEDTELVLEDDVYTNKLSDEAKAKLQARSEMFEEIQEQAREHPEETAELIRAWLVEDQRA